VSYRRSSARCLHNHQRCLAREGHGDAHAVQSVDLSGSTPDGSAVTPQAPASVFTRCLIPVPRQHPGTHMKGKVRLAAAAERCCGFGTFAWIGAGRRYDSEHGLLAATRRVEFGVQLEGSPAAFGTRCRLGCHSPRAYTRSRAHGSGCGKDLDCGLDYLECRPSTEVRQPRRSGLHVRRRNPAPGCPPHAAPAGPYSRDTAAPRTLPGGGPWATRARPPRAPVPRAAELRRTALVGLG
jgi:hypothetical protein